MRSRESYATDAVFECLAEPARRAVIEVLCDRTTATLDELADAVAEQGDTRGGPADRLVPDLHHRHLPKLADAGLVEYDAEGGVVEVTERTRAADVVAQSVEQCSLLSPDVDATGGEPVHLD